MSDIVFMGPPGSGKGTQAGRLAAAKRWVHLATGDLFRHHLAAKTALGELARGYIDRGELVPDDVTVRMVDEKLREIGPTPVVFDGFPRTVDQAVALERLVVERGRGRLGRVVLLDVPREALIDRIAGRATCSRCQAVYNVRTNPPRRPGICDACGGPVLSRSDETPEVVANRLDVYERQTRPLVDHFRRGRLLVEVDGTGTLEEVAARVAKALG